MKKKRKVKKQSIQKKKFQLLSPYIPRMREGARKGLYLIPAGKQGAFIYFIFFIPTRRTLDFGFFCVFRADYQLL